MESIYEEVYAQWYAAPVTTNDPDRKTFTLTLRANFSAE